LTTSSQYANIYGRVSSLHVISRKALREFWARHPDAEQALPEWFKVATKATWRDLTEVRKMYRSADAVERWTVFNIRGNRYRLITEIDYVRQVTLVRHVLTHAEYDRNNWKQGR
jgi:mRNA interferase HigB